MYAIIRTAGKQYRVTVGEEFRVNKIEKTLGAEFDLTDVLFVGGDKSFIGEPTVKNAKVTLVVTEQGKEAKVIVFKKKRRHNYRRLKGHRQPFTSLFVKAITSPDGTTVTASEKPTIVQPRDLSPEGVAKRSAEAKAVRLEARKAGTPVVKKTAAPKKTAKAKTAKKTAGKKKPAKKASAKTKTTKKSAK